MSIWAILQARSSSSRLPGKVLKPLLGEPMLARQIERILRCQRLDGLLIATSDASDDDAIAALAARLQLPCFRGSLNDVLSRYAQAAAGLDAEQIVRLTGDCPLTDPTIIDAVIDQHLREGNDYTSNCAPATLPDGLDVEVVRKAVLLAADAQAIKPSEREHVTLYVRNHAEQFKLGNYHHQPDLSGLRWTVDEPEDFAFVSAVYAALYPQRPDFTTADILALLQQQPQLGAINHRLERNEGLLRSLQQDKELGYE